MVEVTRAEIGVNTAELDQGKVALDNFTAAGRRAQAAMTDLGTASNRARTLTTQVGRASQHTANLAAQFNDIGVMLAAGQSPFQLALQQGTQINQVLSQLGGGASALTSLRAAFFSVISPANLLTLGIIAGGAALVQMAMAGWETVDANKELRDSVESLSKAFDSYKRSVADAISPTDDLIDKFGTLSDAMQTAFVAQAEANLRALKDEVKGAVAAITPEIEGLYDNFRVFQDEQLLEQFGLDRPFMVFTQDARTARDELDKLAKDYRDAAMGIKEANTLEEQFAAAEKLRGAYTALAEADGQWTETENERVNLVTQLMDRIAQAIQQQENLRAKADARAQEAIEKQYISAGDLLVATQRELELKQATLRYGEESAQVKALEREATREAVVEQLRQLDVAQSVKDEILATVDETYAVDDATADWAVTMSGVATQIRAIASALASIGGGLVTAASNRIEIAALREGKTRAEAAREVEKATRAARQESEKLGINSGLGRFILSGKHALEDYNAEQEVTLSREREIAAERERLAKKAERGGGRGRKKKDEYKSDLEALIDSLRTERSVEEEWYSEGKDLLEDRRALELLGKEKHNLALEDLENKHAAEMVRIKQQEAAHVLDAQNSMYSELGNLLSFFGTKSKAAAVAAIALNTFLRAREAAQNTAAAMVRALAELGPIAGPPAAAKIGAFGKAQVAMILAGGALQAGSAMSGGGSSGGSTSGLGESVVDTPTTHRILVEGLDETSLYTGAQIKKLVGAIQEEFDNQGLQMVFK